MGVGTEIYNRLKTLAGGRVSPQEQPKPIYPYLVYSISGGVEIGIDASPLIPYLLTITVVSQAYTEAVTMGADVRGLLDRQQFGAIEYAKFESGDEEPTQQFIDGNFETSIFSTDQTYTVWLKTGV